MRRSYHQLSNLERYILLAGERQYALRTYESSYATNQTLNKLSNLTRMEGRLVDNVHHNLTFARLGPSADFGMNSTADFRPRLGVLSDGAYDRTEVLQIP